MKRLSLLLCCIVSLLAAAPAPAALAVPGAVDRIVAVVNEDVITALELAAEMDRIKDQLRAQKTPPPPDAVLEKQLLDRLILRQIQLQMAERARVRVNDDALNAALENLARQNKLSLPEFRATLEREGIDYAAFREDMRKEITVSRLQAREVHNRITVSEQEIDAFLSNQALQDRTATEYHLAHILIAVPEAASSDTLAAAKARAERLVAALRAGADFAQTAIAESDGQQALQGGDLGWRTAAALPNLFMDSVLAMAVNAVSDPIRNPSGFHIIKLLEQRAHQPQVLVNQTHARHILIKTDDLTDEDEALARIRQLALRLDSGEDFATLAKTHSEDTVSAVNGGDLGWLSPGQTVPAFEKAMDELSVHALSSPVRTPFGWHLIEVLERRQHDSTEDTVRNQAREAIRRGKIEPALETWLRRLRDEAYVENRLTPP
jgi:peptidyl-prolyl cis-trans isomerase SurA